jgi:hypothetical protein
MCFYITINILNVIHHQICVAIKQEKSDVSQEANNNDTKIQIALYFFVYCIALILINTEHFLKLTREKHKIKHSSRNRKKRNELLKRLF